MTNSELILAEKIIRGIEEDAHTYATWKQMGYKVKKGEKAAFNLKIWKKKNAKDDAVEEEAGENKSYYYMKLSHFFTFSQVERI